MNIRVPTFRLYYDNHLVAQIPLNRAEFVIGRRTTSSLRILDTSISREHAKIALAKDGSLSIEDLSSTNGTFVNKTRILKSSLKHNDVVTLGRISLVFQEVSPRDLGQSKRSLWQWFRNRRSLPPLSEPQGQYVLLKTDTVTVFDAISFAMIQHSSKTEESKADGSSFLKTYPRLQVLAQIESRDDEVTRFSVSEALFEGDSKHLLESTKEASVVFHQPGMGKVWIRLPWKTIELILIPLVLVMIALYLGRDLLKFHIESELERAERHWDQKLSALAASYQYANDSMFSTGSKGRARQVPLPVSEVWERIDAQPTLRNFLLFEILDEVLSTEGTQWSLDEAIKNLSKIQSITSRLPSVKSMHVVFKAEASPFNLEGLLEGRVWFLTDRTGDTTAPTSYAKYRAEMTSHLGVISDCASVRRTPTPGKVVLAFTVGGNGKISSVLINKAKSSQEKLLWTCVEQKLKAAELGPPPSGALSIVYTFAFAGAQKLEF